MTDKSRQPEDRNSAVRSNRGSAPVTMAQTPAPGSGLLPPTNAAHYSLHAEIPGMAHSTMHYGHMLHPSFGISLHGLSAGNVQPQPMMSSELGPPIFMPTLNLGVPNTSNSLPMSAAGLSPNNTRPVTPTLSQSSSDLNTSCHNSFPPTMGPTAAQFSSPAMLRSSSLSPHSLTKPSTPPIQVKPAPPTLNSLKNPKTPTTVGVSSVGGRGNSSYPVSTLKQVRGQGSPSTSVHSPLVSVGNSEMLPLAFSSAGTLGLTSPIGLIKPTLSKTATTHTVIELASGNAVMSHTPRPVPRPPVSASHAQSSASQVSLAGKQVSGGKNMDDTKATITGLGQSDGLSSLMDAAGSNLICLEGMASLGGARQTVVTTLATPTSSTTTAVMDLRAERPPQLPTSSFQPYHSQQPLLLTSDTATYHFHTTTSSAPSIPRPEAISKNIIIPATNLTGKDIANLTSSAASSAATSPVVESLPSFDRLPSGDVLAQQASAVLPSDPLSSELKSSEINTPSSGALGRVPALMQTGHVQSPPPNPAHPPPVLQHDATLSPHVGLGHALQTNNSSSPRPSILRKRPHESGRGIEGAVSPLSSQNLARLSSVSLLGAGRVATVPESPSGLFLQENHLRENSDLVLSPRKRPRKQQFEAMADSCFPQSLQSNEDSSAIDAAEASYTHNSIIANERLPGPLPLRNKVTVSEAAHTNKPPPLIVEKEIRYLSQLRRCRYPIAAHCRISHRAAHHFRRHADIKHREEVRVMLHEVANSGSTWLRASGWKINHVSEQLSEMEDVKHDVLSAMEGLQATCQTFLDTPSCCFSQEHKRHLMELIQGNLDRSKRAVEHIEESRKVLLSVLEQQPKVVDLLKKYATQLPFDPTIQPFS